MGRFISEDPISFAAGDSNIYRYVGNNPLFYLDPSGFCGVGSSGGGDGGEPEFFGPGFGPNFTPSPSGDDEEPQILAGTTIVNPKSALATLFAAIAAYLHISNENNPETQRRREEFDEFIRNQGDNSQPLETTTGDNTNEFDPNRINDRDQQIVEPGIEVETFPGTNDGSLDSQTGEFPDVNDTGIEVETFPQGNDGLTVDRFDVDIEVTDSQGNPFFGPGYIGNDFPVNDSQIRHILRDRPGHIPDTLENRQLLRDIANDYRNYLGPDKHGTSWFSKTLPDGKQVWVRTRDGIINNAGVNDIGDTRTYNPETGLNRRTPPTGN